MQGAPGRFAAGLGLAALIGLALIAVVRGQPAPADLVIAGGTVVDGTGAKARRADVAIREGRIVGVGRLGKLPARERLDAKGLVVAPGFVDVHTHADRIAEKPLAENFVRMGVTTIVAGNCGSSALDVGGALAEIARVGVSPNFATLVGPQHRPQPPCSSGRAGRRRPTSSNA